jgi:hypothetical protein
MAAAGSSKAMEQWHQDFTATLEQQLEDSDEDFEEMMICQSLQELRDEVLAEPARRGGSTVGRKSVPRNRIAGHQGLMADYFCECPIYDALYFRHRFRMRRQLFVRIVDAVTEQDPHFVQRPDAIGALGLSPLQKCTVAMRMLAYGASADSLDEYCRLAESTALESLLRFVQAVRSCFQAHYLRQPSRADLDAQVAINSAQGFPGMFGSLDCMHWDWAKCPTAWQAQYQDKDGNRSVILEAIADQGLWIWHAYFGIPGVNNDVNVLDRSPLVAEFLGGQSKGMTFTVNRNVYPRYYLLTDGIYPQWACFVQTIHEPEDEKKAHYAKRQEAVHKDVERAFGVLQQRWAIIANPARHWNLETITNIMMCCIVLHNMILDDERGLDLEQLFDGNFVLPPRQHNLTFHELREGTRQIEDIRAYFSLRNALIEHLWQLRGEERY